MSRLMLRPVVRNLLETTTMVLGANFAWMPSLVTFARRSQPSRKSTPLRSGCPFVPSSQRTMINGLAGARADSVWRKGALPCYLIRLSSEARSRSIERTYVWCFRWYELVRTNGPIIPQSHPRQIGVPATKKNTSACSLTLTLRKRATVGQQARAIPNMIPAPVRPPRTAVTRPYSNTYAGILKHVAIKLAPAIANSRSTIRERACSRSNCVDMPTTIKVYHECGEDEKQASYRRCEACQSQ